MENVCYPESETENNAQDPEPLVRLASCVVYGAGGTDLGVEGEVSRPELVLKTHCLGCGEIVCS